MSKPAYIVWNLNVSPSFSDALYFTVIPFWKTKKLVKRITSFKNIEIYKALSIKLADTGLIPISLDQMDNWPI